MDVKELLKSITEKAVKTVYDIDLSDVYFEHPENEKHGDYATNVAMTLAKSLKKSPMSLAEAISYEILNHDNSFFYDNTPYPIFSKIEAVQPGFINFTLSTEWLCYSVKEILRDQNTFGSLKIGANKKILIEFSEPNPNKPQHIGHARNNFIGSSLSNVFKFAGYDVVRVNYINDWGTHIGKSMLMYLKYGNDAEPDKKPDHFVGDFYKKYEQEEEKNPQIKEELAQLFRKLESGDPDTLALWRKMVGWAYKGWEETYKNQNVVFDVWMYQSNYKDSGKELVKIAQEKGIAEKDTTGAIVARLEKYNIPDKVLLRSDGTSIYSTQDLQLAKDSYDTYHFDKRLYVVDYRQSDYFKQIFKILEILGFDWAKKLYHVAYGTVDLPEGKMSSRSGLVINADTVFDNIVESEEVEISQGIKRENVSKEVVSKVALAAFRYGLLKVDPSQDIVFKYDQVTKFEGNTGPYLLYTYARINSLLEKVGMTPSEIKLDFQDSLSVQLNEKEINLMRKLYKFPEIVATSVSSLSSHNVANYVYDIAQTFNSFYGEVPIVSSADIMERNFRLALSAATAWVIKNSLGLLGIEVVSKM